MNIEVMRTRTAERVLEQVRTTDALWDRDCRCCLELMRHYTVNIPRDKSLFDAYRERTGRKDYTIKGAGHKIVIAAGQEEVHADHSVAELVVWSEAFYARGNR
jgi:hypothetical protein